MKDVILKQFFAPIKARFRLLLLLPALNLLILSIVLLFRSSPKEAILLAMAGISLTVFLVGSKRFVSLFYYSSLLFNLMIFVVTWSNDALWTKVWSLSMMISLSIAYFLSKEVLDFFYKEERAAKESEAEKGLWRNRFETLRDTHNMEIVNLEEELSKSLDGFTEKNKQIEALERLVEVTHKEAGILSKQKHELLDKVRCQSDGRDGEEIKKQNITLQKEIDRLSHVQRDAQALREEQSATMDKISALKQANKEFEETSTAEIDSLRKEIETLRVSSLEKKGKGGYSPEDIIKMLQGLSSFEKDKTHLELVTNELKEKLNVVNKPFKWQVWKGEKKEKSIPTSKTKISMTDLGKGLKI
ncbi:MAG: hypothetical protein SP4CHLAM5_09960 [Chlamydiia bacterium]|nr:hypothetical protein [Chlamydiia bacterium]MCH9618854.1 hypothetical protein [Chlamydiia bacterium]MCH9624545.1 hypothetical protein [Chlamydiia bacterium]